MISKKNSAVFVVIFISLFGSAASEVVEEIIAIVNDDIITLSQYKEYHDSLYQLLRAQLQGEEFEKQYTKLKGEILDNMITELLLLQLAKEKRLNVSEQVRATIEQIKKENNIESDEQLRRELGRQGMDYEQWLKHLEDNLLRQALVFTEVDRSIVIEDSESVNYYKSHSEEFVEPEEYKLRAIYLSSDERGEDERRALMKEIENRIKAGDDFGALAGQYSDGPIRESQGDLGALKKGELDATLQAAIARLRPGETAAWVQAKAGWYLLKLEEKKDSRLKSFEEVKREIEEKIFSEKRTQKMKDFLEEIKKKSYIKILKTNPLNL
ncbi:MAG: peptidylprolyl isomerase [Clostridiales bacterium]|nr:peptidylprolyl isomerase [Clostridiales bacterium]